MVWLTKRKPLVNKYVIVYVPGYCESEYQIAKWTDDTWESDSGDNLTDLVEGWSAFTHFVDAGPSADSQSFRSQLKDLLVSDGTFVEFDKIGSIKGWPTIEDEPLSCENVECKDITKTKAIFHAGGDWQDPQDVTIELVNNELTVTSYKAGDFPEEILSEEQIIQLLENETA